MANILGLQGRGNKTNDVSNWISRAKLASTCKQWGGWGGGGGGDTDAMSRVFNLCYKLRKNHVYFDTEKDTVVING